MANKFFQFRTGLSFTQCSNSSLKVHYKLFRSFTYKTVNFRENFLMVCGESYVYGELTDGLQEVF